MKKDSCLPFSYMNKGTKPIKKEIKTNFLTNNNSKLKYTSEINDARIFEFNLPAYKIDNEIVCPFADECKFFCYAKKGTYLYKNVVLKYKNNYYATKKDNFVNLIQKEIDKKKPTHIRVHSSGDYYNIKYLKKWYEIANNNKHIIFYSYTNSKPFFKNDKLPIPKNYRIIFSLGGKKDNLINIKKDRHAKIFKNESDLINNGYINASKNDFIAIGTSKKIGLIFH